MIVNGHFVKAKGPCLLAGRKEMTVGGVPVEKGDLVAYGREGEDDSWEVYRIQSFGGSLPVEPLEQCDRMEDVGYAE